MKYTYVLLILLWASLLYSCATDNKITYNIPPEYPKEKRKELLATINKGKELYKVNCAGCHGVFTKGNDSITNFSNTQIDNYSARFMRHDPKNHSVARKMSPEQLNNVLMFLRYKKVAKKAGSTIAHTTGRS